VRNLPKVVMFDYTCLIIYVIRVLEGSGILNFLVPSSS